MVFLGFIFKKKAIMKILQILGFLFLFGFSYAQENFNMELIATVELGEPGNDVWGYVDSDDTEYAIIGGRASTRVYSLANPADPQLLVSIPGPASTWRDMKDYNDHIYVTTDQGGTTEGLLIIDMTAAPDSATWSYWKPFIDFTDARGNNVSGQLNTCHNLYIDENGICYLAGCGGIGNRGVIMLDLNQDPKNPVVVGVEDENYSHDAYARGDTLYSSEISANPGQLTIYDVSKKDSVVNLGTVVTTFEFCHNTWISDDGKYAFTTDERANANVDAYDITDPSDMKLLDIFHPLDTEGQGVIPHNTHYLNGYLITSWYTDGIVITDVHDPTVMVEVGHFDTFDGPHGGFNGCWGAYPFLPSGLVLASNISGASDGGGALYVFQPTYKRASYLKGAVSDFDTGLPINNVSVEILDTRLNKENTNSAGEYATGVADEGTFQVKFSHPEYLTEIRDTNISCGETTILLVQMKKLESFNITGSTVKSTDGSGIPNSKVLFVSENNSFEFETDGDGNFSGEMFQDTYEVFAGSWGYKHAQLTPFAVEIGDNIVIELDRGYQDDFIFDLGWEVSGDAETGAWERATPIGTDFNGSASNPGVDIDGDLGTQCYTTGNGGNNAGFDDVDDGETILTSDVMDLTWYNGPAVEYALWFVNVGGSGGNPDDELTVSVSNGVETVELEQTSTSIGLWRPVSSFFLPDYIDITDQMTISFSTADQGEGHIVEAAVDVFEIIEGMPSNTTDIEGLNNLEILPNPFNQNLRIRLDAEHVQNLKISLLNANGQEAISLDQINNGMIEINTDFLPSGVYILQLTDGKNSSTRKLIKQ